MFQSSLGHTINESQMKHLLKTCTIILNTDSTIRHVMQTMHASAIRPVGYSIRLTLAAQPIFNSVLLAMIIISTAIVF